MKKSWMAMVVLGAVFGTGCVGSQVEGGDPTVDLEDEGTTGSSNALVNAPEVTPFITRIRCRLTAYAPFNAVMDETATGSITTTRDTDGGVSVHGPMYRFTPTDTLDWGVGIRSTEHPDGYATSFIVFTRPQGTKAWTRLAPVKVMQGLVDTHNRIDVDFYTEWRVDTQGTRDYGKVPAVYQGIFRDVSWDPASPPEFGFFPIPSEGELTGTRSFAIALTTEE